MQSIIEKYSNKCGGGGDVYVGCVCVGGVVGCEGVSVGVT